MRVIPRHFHHRRVDRLTASQDVTSGLERTQGRRGIIRPTLSLTPLVDLSGAGVIMDCKPMIDMLFPYRSRGRVGRDALGACQWQTRPAVTSYLRITCTKQKENWRRDVKMEEEGSRPDSQPRRRLA